MTHTRITSMKALQERVPEILERVCRDHRVMLAATANPILALEDLGYEVSPQVLTALEDRCRFSKPDVAARRTLRRQLFELAGRPFDPSSEEDLLQLLHGELAIGTRAEVRRGVARPRYVPSRQTEQDAPRDPLEALKGKHPVIEPLLEYRRIDAGAAPFASPRLYTEIKSGKRSFPLAAVRVRLAGEEGVVAETRAPG